MTPPTTAMLAHLIAENAALRLALVGAGGVNASATVGGITVTVKAAGDGLPDAPTECERDILEAIRVAGRRLTQPMLFTALPNHGESTIVKALARMSGDGRLHHIAKRGYAVMPAPSKYIPTECEQEIIDLLTRAGRRILLPEFIAKLCPPHGESTVRDALGKLGRIGIIGNVPKRGYAMTPTEATP